MSNGHKLTLLAYLWFLFPSSSCLTLSHWFVLQGGGILAAFTSFFPDLVDNKVAFIAPTGLVEVTVMLYYCPLIC